MACSLRGTKNGNEATKRTSGLNNSAGIKSYIQLKTYATNTREFYISNRILEHESERGKCVNWMVKLGLGSGYCKSVLI